MMNVKLNPGSKVLVLISDDTLFDRVKGELLGAGFEVEESLHMFHECRMAIMDYFYLRSGIPDYLNSIGTGKIMLLMLTQQEMHSGNVRSHGIFHDIIVLRENDGWSPDYVVSALEGETTFRRLFEEYLPKFLERGPAGRESRDLPVA